MKIVGLEEHFATPELIDAWQALEPQWRDVGIPGSADDEQLLLWPTQRRH